ncbi:PAS domain S-box protein [Aurantimonas sp. A2-1-M11]|uniref:PAS domain-containing protein n=1 Tax=Aurantimonas sp. A2-1-M11 TaxID=3113712 RepID=UPI002F943E30
MESSSEPGDRGCETPSFELARAVLENATDYAIITIDLQGQITSWNAGAENILGWASEEICGQPAAVFYTDSDRAVGVPESEMESALKTGRGNDERWHQRDDKSCFWASGEMMPLKDDVGEPIGFLKILRDRTAEKLKDEDRIAAAKALADSEALKTAMLDAALDCIITIDDR